MNMFRQFSYKNGKTKYSLMQQTKDEQVQTEAPSRETCSSYNT